MRERRAVGVEALARFAGAPFAPDLWFAEAEAVGLRLPLEIAAARTALGSLSSEKDLLWTNDAATDLAERPIAAQFGLATYVSAPLTGGDGRVLGTLCAGSREPLYISDAAVAQLQLIAHVIATEMRNARPAAPPS